VWFGRTVHDVLILVSQCGGAALVEGAVVGGAVEREGLVQRESEAVAAIERVKVNVDVEFKVSVGALGAALQPGDPIKALAISIHRHHLEQVLRQGKKQADDSAERF